MPIDWRHVLALSLLCLVGCSEAQLVVTASTEASLKVGDYADQLSDGTALPLYILVWRAVGTSFSDPSGVNQTFATDANNAFLAANHSMTYTVANIRNAAVLNTTRKINGTAGGQTIIFAVQQSPSPKKVKFTVSCSSRVEHRL